MTEAMPFLQKYDITFLRPPAFNRGLFFVFVQIGCLPRNMDFFVTNYTNEW